MQTAVSAIWLEGYAESSARADQIHMRPIDLSGGDERFEHGVRPLGAATDW